MGGGLISEDKRRWQIALRRYVLEGRPATEYAPYFGIDSARFRDWIELHFKPSMKWGSFGSIWQFEHVVPLSFFQNVEEDLRLCWNFINIRPCFKNPEGYSLFNIQEALSFFQDLELKSGYEIAGKFVFKLRLLNEAAPKNADLQADFLCVHLNYLEKLQTLKPAEFELVNKGKSIEEAIRQVEEIRKLSALG